MTVGNTYLAVAIPGNDCGKYWEGNGEIRDDQGQIYAKACGKYFMLSAAETTKIAQELRYQPGDPPVFHYPNLELSGCGSLNHRLPHGS